MSVLMIIDGLLMASDPSPAAFCPQVTRLAAVGKRGLWEPGPDSVNPERGLTHGAILCGDGDGWLSGELPLGYLAALGMGLSPDEKKSWAVLELMHLFQKTNKLLFFSPERVGLTQEEKKSLLLELEDEFCHQEFQMHWSDEWGSAVISTARDLSAQCLPAAVLDGESFFESMPVGDDANELLALITTGQMLLARAEVNRAREKRRDLPLNTPWVWGLGRGFGNLPGNDGVVSKQGRALSSDPVFAGLARLAGFAPGFFDEGTEPESDLMEHLLSSGNGVIHFRTPALLARLGLVDERRQRLQEIDSRFIAPLAARLGADGGKLLITTPARLNELGRPETAAVPWLVAQGSELRRKKRFWHNRKLAAGPSIAVGDLHREWTS